MMHDAALLRDLDPLEPFRKASRHILLPEPFGRDSLRIPLHGDRPAGDVRKHDRRNGFAVTRQIALGNSGVWKQHLLGMRNHGASRTTSRAALSTRRPSSR